MVRPARVGTGYTAFRAAQGRPGSRMGDKGTMADWSRQTARPMPLAHRGVPAARRARLLGLLDHPADRRRSTRRSSPRRGRSSASPISRCCSPTHAVRHRFWNALRNNTWFFIIHMLVQNPIGLLLAALLSHPRLRLRGFYRTLIFMPTMLSRRDHRLRLAADPVARSGACAKACSSRSGCMAVRAMAGQGGLRAHRLA